MADSCRVWQKTTKFCKAIIIQLKKIKLKKLPYKQNSRTRWLYRQVQSNIQEELIPILPKIFKKNERNTLKDILWSHHHPDIKTRHDTTKTGNHRPISPINIDAIILQKLLGNWLQRMKRSCTTTRWDASQVHKDCSTRAKSMWYTIAIKQATKNTRASQLIHKSICQIQHPLMTETLTKVGIKGTYLNIINVTYDKSTANIISNSEKLKTFLLKSGTKQGYSHLFYSSQY